MPVFGFIFNITNYLKTVTNPFLNLRLYTKVWGLPPGGIFGRGLSLGELSPGGAYLPLPTWT